MTKPKDPEVIDEMQAAGQAPEDEKVAAKDGDDDGAKTGSRGASKGNTKKSSKKASKKASKEASEETSEDAAADRLEGDDTTRDDAAGDDLVEDEPTAGELTEEEIAAAEEMDRDPQAPHPAEIIGEIPADIPADIPGEYHPEEQHQRSLAATALMILIGAIVVAAGTLWAAPRVAPHLPASIGQYLMPGQMTTAAEIAALREAQAGETGRIAEQIAALQARLDSAESAIGDVTARLDGLADPAAAAATAAEALDLARAANAQAAALTASAGATASELAALRDNIAAVNAALADAGSGDEGAAPAELSAAVAALNARLDSLSGSAASKIEVAASTGRIDEIAARIDALEASAADARSAQTQALGEVSTAIRQASLRSAVAALTSHVESGQAFAAPLTEIATLTGVAPPPALAGAAETGLATDTALSNGFGPHAQAAIAADVQTRSGDGVSSQVLGWLRAQVTGRPVTEQAGEGVAAITSRIAARVGEGALAEALREAESLPPHSQAALGDWLGQLRARVEAEAALSAWLAEIGANG